MTLPLPFGSVVGAFLLAFPALFSIVNPLGAALIFHEVTADRTHEERVRLAGRVAIYSLAVLLISAWFGGFVLNFFGISLGALRIGGGLVVAASAWMLLMSPEQRHAAKQEQAAPSVDADDPAFFPLTIPFTAGPGTISVAIALVSVRPAGQGGVLPFLAGVTAAAVAVAASIWVAYRFADRVLDRMDKRGAAVIARLVAFLLLCIGVQIIVSGVEEVFGRLMAGQRT